MRTLVYRAAARRDLIAIFTYIAEESGSTETARRFVDRLREQCRKLATLPGTLGRARPELRPGIRSFPFQGYVIFFKVSETVLEIVTIVERHRDVEAVFTEPP